MARNTKHNDMKTIQYMGSKRDLMYFIEASLQAYGNEFEDFRLETLFDAFCGSGRVAHFFRKKYGIITNDKQSFTKVIMDAHLLNVSPLSFYEPFINELNALNIDDFDIWLSENRTDGWFTKNYSCDYNDGISIGEDGNPKIWLTHNAKKIDMIREKINEYFDSGKIDAIQKNVLLYSSILAINAVSNVIGHQNGYLKKWCTNAQRNLEIKMPDIDEQAIYEHCNYQGDIFDVMKLINHVDLAYFDPPYGTNNKNLVVATRYSSFYHLWNTFLDSKKNERPVLFGKAGKPLSTKGFTDPLEKNLKNVVMPKFIKLIEECNCDYVAISYSNKSLLTSYDMKKVFELAGCDMNTYRLYIHKHKSNSQNVTAKKEGLFINRGIEDEQLIEYFFLAKKKYSHQRITNPDVKGDVVENLLEVDDYLENTIEDYITPLHAPYIRIMDNTTAKLI